MTVEELVAQLGLQASAPGDMRREVTGGYASDLLSCVMAGAAQGHVWITLQVHVNIVAVASLLGLVAIIITEGAQPAADTLARAAEERIPILTTPMSTFEVAGRLYELGLRGR